MEHRAVNAARALPTNHKQAVFTMNFVDKGAQFNAFWRDAKRVALDNLATQMMKI